MNSHIIWLIIFLSLNVFAQNPEPDWILDKIDENMSASNRISEAEMIIHGRRGDRTVRSKSWIRGTEMAFTEYLAPPRERGTKMLKEADNLWTYFPRTDRTVLIAGHLLRQSVMGSDLSYEDLMEDPKLKNLYNAQIAGEDTVIGRPCWILELSAKNPEVAYHARKIWVDQERFLTLKENRYAKSGRLIKTTNVTSIRKVEDRWVAEKIVFKDELKSGSGTEFVLISVQFDTQIPDYIFSKANLRK
jgi:outer membrane lipoprotein-sorting protein